MNWKKRKLITAITAIVTIGALYAFVGTRHHQYNNHGCHWQQEKGSSCETHKSEVPENSQKENEE
jgi:hypothetical protein